MDVYALCRVEYGMSYREFLAITLPELEALEERRAIRIRHNRFNAGLIASVLINARRPEDSEAVSPFDFLAGFGKTDEETEAEKLRRSTKQAIALSFTQFRGTAEQVQAKKAAMIARMEANGVEDPAGLIREVFPDL